MKFPLSAAFITTAAFAVLTLTAARADDETTTLKFSDPTQPGTLKIRLAHGDLRVIGVTSTTGEVTVKSDAKAVTSAPRKDGLRVITAAANFSFGEKANVMTLDATENWTRGGGGDFTIAVPRSTSVIVSSAWGGDITCTDLEGDIEIKGLNGEVKLNNLSGGALVETMNGEIKAHILQLREGKPLSFTSMNGEIVLRLPVDAKANIRLRTQNGSILTDFDDKALVTKTESLARAPSARSKRAVTIIRKSTVSNAPETSTHGEISAAVREAVQAGAEIARESAAAIREAAQAAREGLAIARASANAAENDTPGAPTPPLPPMTGGKIVSGTLNGGGPDIRIATMNGDVTLRKMTEQK